jgi:drug/metabolite transporter (DMT)-like permease
MIGVALAILSAATSAISVVLVRKYSNQSSTFNISLAISWVGMLVLWPLGLVLTDFSTANIVSIVLFALSGINSWIRQTTVLSRHEKTGCTSQLVPILDLSNLHFPLSCAFP